MKHKLILINPSVSGKTKTGINGSLKLPSLTLGTIGALTPANYKIILFDENIKPFRFANGNIVCITVCKSSVKRAEQIASEYHRKKIPVVMITNHQSIKSEFADSIITGEAESIWEKLIFDFESRKLKNIYFGKPADITIIPQPRRDLFSNEFICAPVRTSRNNGNNKTKLRMRPISDVLDEIERIPQKIIFFEDEKLLGYGETGEKRAIELFKGMTERRLNKFWFCLPSTDFDVSMDVSFWAAKSGSVKAQMSFQKNMAQ